MESPIRNERLAPSGSPSLGKDPVATDLRDEAEELRFFRQMAKVARRTTATEIDRLFGPVE